LQLSVIPIAFLYANLVEYLSHRNPMHRPIKPISIMFDRHTLSHHKFFTNEAMSFERSDDFQMILFPPRMLLAFFVAALLPAGVLDYFFSRTSALLFVGVGMAYYLLYECLHFTYHLNENTFIGRLWIIKKLRQHHIVHHNPRLMNRYNFNITFPIFDYVLGTVYRGDGNVLPNEPLKSG